MSGGWGIIRFRALERVARDHALQRSSDSFIRQLIQDSARTCIMRFLTFSLGLAIGFLLVAAGPARAQEPELVSEIVARINNDIITSADYAQALRDFKEELARQMAGKTDAEINAEYERLKPTVLDILI